jgi:pimeloyl-ACP methyl ester carboxylesterase
MTRILPLVLLLVSLTPSAAVAADARVTVNVPPGGGVPPGVTVKYSVPPYDGPVVILVPGDDGILSLAWQGWPLTLQKNFLVRSRDHFLNNDLKVVVLDAPSNHGAGTGGLNNQRLTAEHNAVIAAVIRDVRKRFPLRGVWLVGTSNGTLSVANAAARLAGSMDAPTGVILTSTITVAGASGETKSVFSPGYPGLGAITVPTFVVWHQLDACVVSPGGSGMSVFDALTGVAPAQKASAAFQGGGTFGPDCQAEAYHGFNGIEDNVVLSIASFIKARTPAFILEPIGP